MLFDDRPPRSLERRIHMMDEGPIGYRRWHAFIRTAVLINAELDMLHNKWLEIDRDVGLAYAIDSKQHPKQSDRTGNNPNNPEIDSDQLDELSELFGYQKVSRSWTMLLIMILVRRWPCKRSRRILLISYLDNITSSRNSTSYQIVLD